MTLDTADVLDYVFPRTKLSDIRNVVRRSW
jgi:hypothetical protein